MDLSRTRLAKFYVIFLIEQLSNVLTEEIVGTLYAIDSKCWKMTFRS